MLTTPLPNLALPQPQDFDIDESANSLVLALMTGRSYSQHNTVVYKIDDQYRGMPHRHCILMNRLDAEKIGLAEHDCVTVQGDAKQLEKVEVIDGAVRQGAALMFYPRGSNYI
jgi:anaerobic selenocysteine-containing dehydrogenase